MTETGGGSVPGGGGGHSRYKPFLGQACGMHGPVDAEHRCQLQIISLHGQLPNILPCFESKSVQAGTIGGRLSKAVGSAALAGPEQIADWETISTTTKASAVHACHFYLFYINAFVPVTVYNDVGKAGFINLRLGTAAARIMPLFSPRAQK